VALELLKSVKLSLRKMNCSKNRISKQILQTSMATHYKTKAGSNCEKSCKNTKKNLKLQITAKARAGNLNEI
jgi:hypothetical protein